MKIEFQLVIISLFLHVLQARLNDSVMIGLQALYDQTDGHSWSVLSGNLWDFSDDADPCNDTWTGVICGDSNQTLLGLNLTAHNLVGSLQDDVFAEFLDLEVLSLKKNRFASTHYPYQLKNCSNSSGVLSVEYRLRDKIPSSTFQLHLKQLILRENSFSGSLPKELSGLAWR